MSQAPRQRFRVAERDSRVAQRAGVLVDAEREHGRLERCDVELPLGEDRDHRRRQGAVVRADDVLRPDPVELLVTVVVEEDDLDLRVSRDTLEVAQASGVRRLDDDEALDRVEVDPCLLGDVELLRVQAIEVPDVAVQGA